MKEDQFDPNVRRDTGFSQNLKNQFEQQPNISSLELELSKVKEERDRLKEENTNLNKIDLNAKILNEKYEQGYSAAVVWHKDRVEELNKKVGSLKEDRERVIEEMKNLPEKMIMDNGTGVRMIARTSVLMILAPKDK